jgi:DNA-binding LytR/AlgR family response regulator
MTCVIVDDDKISIEFLKKCIQISNELELLAEFTNPVEARKFLTENSVDVAFLDYQMPVITGMELLKSLPNPPRIIFTTSSKEHASDAFEHNVIDYLVKPFPYDRFAKAIDKIKTEIREIKPASDCFFVKVNSQMIKVPKSEILYAEAYGDYVKIHTISGKYVVSIALKELEKDLEADKFARIHRSFIVAINHIEKIIGNEIILGSEKLPVSNSYRAELYSKIKII